MADELLGEHILIDPGAAGGGVNDHVRVILDRERCEGHGICEELAPNVYRLDDDGELEFPLDGVVLGDEVRAAALAGAAACPVAALRVAREEPA